MPILIKVMMWGAALFSFFGLTFVVFPIGPVLWDEFEPQNLPEIAEYKLRRTTFAHYLEIERAVGLNLAPAQARTVSCGESWARESRDSRNRFAPYRVVISADAVGLSSRDVRIMAQGFLRYVDTSGGRVVENTLSASDSHVGDIDAHKVHGKFRIYFQASDSTGRVAIYSHCVNRTADDDASRTCETQECLLE